MDAIAEEVVDGRSSFRTLLTGGHEYSGWLSRDALRIKRRHEYNNSFAPIFHGQIQEYRDGSRIVGQFGLNRAVVVLFYAMAGVGVLFVAAALLGLVFGDPHPTMVGVLVLGLAMAVFMPRARRLQFPRADRDDIEAMLRRVACSDERG